MKRKSFLFSWVCFMVHAMNKILLIDDDIQVRESVSLSLETAGYTVMVAGTSQEGLQNYENFRASLIIMDVVALEDGEGEPIRRVSQQSSSIPLITLTGNIPSSGGSMRFLHQLYQPICTLQKPFTVDELLQTVQRVLAR
jgi:DNA-binding response OmpR family regulator